MKKVIFVCLLTVSVCLSQLAEKVPLTIPDQHAAAPASPAVTTQTTLTPTQSTLAPTQSTQASSAPINPTDVPKTDAPKPKEGEAANAITVAPEHKETSNSMTDDKKNGTITTTVKLAGQKVTTAAPAKSPEKVSTVKPAATTEEPPALQARRFDGASFVGGIILTLGLLAIGFMGFKYYKAQTERNYHTL